VLLNHDNNYWGGGVVFTGTVFSTIYVGVGKTRDGRTSVTVKMGKAPCIMEVFIIFSQGSKQANRLIDNRLRLRTISGAVSK